MKISIVGLAAAALLCTSAVAQADPVSITSGGWLNATFEDCGAVTLVSDQFNVHAGWECLNGGFGPLTSGAVINLTTTTTASQSVLGTGTVAGVSYDFRTPLRSPARRFGSTYRRQSHFPLMLRRQPL